MTLGDLFAFNLFLGLLIAPVFQIVAIGTQITEALAGLERTREILNEKKEEEDPRRTFTMDASTAESSSKMSTSPTIPASSSS